MLKMNKSAFHWALIEIRITIQFTGELRDVSDLSTLQSRVNFNQLRYLTNNIEDCVWFYFLSNFE